MLRGGVGDGGNLVINDEEAGRECYEKLIIKANNKNMERFLNRNFIGGRGPISFAT